MATDRNKWLAEVMQQVPVISDPGRDAESQSAVVQMLRRPSFINRRETLISERPTQQELDDLMTRIEAVSLETDSIARILEKMPLPEIAMLRRVLRVVDSAALLQKAEFSIRISIGR